MRHTPKTQLLALVLTSTATLLANGRLFAADQPRPPPSAKSFPTPCYPRHSQSRPHAQSPSVAVARPSPQKPAAAMEKLKDLVVQLRRTLDIAFDLLSGNETDLLSRNKTALLSATNRRFCRAMKPSCSPRTRRAVVWQQTGDSIGQQTGDSHRATSRRSCLATRLRS